MCLRAIALITVELRLSEARSSETSVNRKGERIQKIKFKSRAKDKFSKRPAEAVRRRIAAALSELTLIHNGRTPHHRPLPLGAQSPVSIWL